MKYIDEPEPLYNDWLDDIFMDGHDNMTAIITPSTHNGAKVWTVRLKDNDSGLFMDSVSRHTSEASAMEEAVRLVHGVTDEDEGDEDEDEDEE